MMSSLLQWKKTHLFVAVDQATASFKRGALWVSLPQKLESKKMHETLK